MFSWYNDIKCVLHTFQPSSRWEFTFFPIAAIGEPLQRRERPWPCRTALTFIIITPFGWGSASSAKIQRDRTRKPDWANVPLSALKLLAVESWSLGKANLRVSGLCYRAGATHGLPGTEVILCVVVCVLGPCHCVVPAVNSAGAGAVIRGNCRESTLSPRQSFSPHYHCLRDSWESKITQFHAYPLGELGGPHFSLN